MESFFEKIPSYFRKGTMYFDYFVTIVHNSNKISKIWHLKILLYVGISNSTN